MTRQVVCLVLEFKRVDSFAVVAFSDRVADALLDNSAFKGVHAEQELEHFRQGLLGCEDELLVRDVECRDLLGSCLHVDKELFDPAHHRRDKDRVPLLDFGEGLRGFQTVTQEHDHVEVGDEQIDGVAEQRDLLGGAKLLVHARVHKRMDFGNPDCVVIADTIATLQTLHPKLELGDCLVREVTASRNACDNFKIPTQEGVACTRIRAESNAVRQHVNSAVQETVALLLHPVKLSTARQVLAEEKLAQFVEVQSCAGWTSSDAKSVVKLIAGVDESNSIAKQHVVCLVALCVLHRRVDRKLVHVFSCKHLVVAEKFNKRKLNQADLARGFFNVFSERCNDFNVIQRLAQLSFAECNCSENILLYSGYSLAMVRDEPQLFAGLGC